MQETSYCACFFSVKIHERVFSSTLWALMQERSLTQIPTATSTWTSYFVTADAKCITFLDFQKFEFCKEIQTQLTVNFVRHYINLCNSIKSCSITGLTPSQAIYLDQNCCPTASCKKTFSFQWKNALVMLYEMKIHFVYKGHCSAQSCKNGRDNCRHAQNKTAQWECCEQQPPFPPSKYQENHSGVSVGLARCFEDFTVRLRGLHGLCIIQTPSQIFITIPGPPSRSLYFNKQLGEWLIT